MSGFKALSTGLSALVLIAVIGSDAPDVQGQANDDERGQGQIVGEISRTFDEQETELIEDAVAILNDEMFGPELRRNYTSETLRTSLMPHVNVDVGEELRALILRRIQGRDSSRTEGTHYAIEVLREQLHALASRDIKVRILAPSDEQTDFPGCIENTNKDLRKVIGWACPGTARIEFRESERSTASRRMFSKRLSGQFEVVLNQSKMAEKYNPRYWAGNLAHEISHNLGHMHPMNTTAGDGWLPFVVGCTIRHEGEYQVDTPCSPRLRCTGVDGYCVMMEE